MNVAPERSAGSLFVELAIALTTLTLAVLTFLAVLYPNLRARAMAAHRDEVRVALENAAEILRHEEFDELYATRHGTRIPVPGLQGPGGAPAAIEITCFVDETSLPHEFGPVSDLDGNPDSETTNASLSYELLPVRLSLEYMDHDETERRELYLLIREAEPLGSGS